MKLDIQLFASGSFEFDNYESYIRGKIEWESTALNDNNQSRVTARIYARRTSGSTTGRQWTGYVNIGGNYHSFDQIYTGSSTTIGTSWVLVEYWTDTINHNADGTKTITISGEVTGPSGTTLAGKSSWGSRSVTLDSIPRASTPTFSPSPATLGESVTISTNRYVNTFTHDITYSIGSTSGTIGTGITETTTWTPPITLANEITSSTTGDCIITCTTYNGDTLIGTKQVTLQLNVPASIVPTVTIGTLTEADTTMQGLNWGVFVQNKSKLNIPITASGVYGSTIVSIITTINGLSFSGNNITTSTLITAGTNTITTTATDTRGRTATTTTTYNVVAYSNPSITTAQVQRCLSNGTVSEDGTYLLYSFVGTISEVSNHNDKYFKIGYKRTIDDDYTYVTISTNYTISSTNAVSTFTISPDYSYDIVFQAIDSFMTTEINKSIYVGFDLLNFNASGKAIAIGKVSEAGANEELLEIDLPMQVTQPITSTDTITATDYSGTWEGYTNDLGTTSTSGTSLVLSGTSIQTNNIVQSGSNSDGSYVKYADGTMICWKTISKTVSITNGWGNMYESTSAISLGNWAATFYAKPTTNVTKTAGQGSWLELVQNISTTSCGSTYVVSAVSRSNVSVTFDIIGIGRWKA